MYYKLTYLFITYTTIIGVSVKTLVLFGRKIGPTQTSRSILCLPETLDVRKLKKRVVCKD